MASQLFRISLACFLVQIAFGALAPVASAGAPNPTVLPDTQENRRAAAQRYVDVTAPMERMHELLHHSIATSVPEARRAEVYQWLRNQIRFEVLIQAMTDALVKHLTAGEIDALARFYATPDGQAIMKKHTAWNLDVMEAFRAELVRINQEASRR